MTDRIDSEGALKTAYEQLEHLRKMLARVVEQHRDDARALRLQTLQITRLMEDIQAEIDEYRQRARAAAPSVAETAQP
jgi:archaellum component FlaC